METPLSIDWSSGVTNAWTSIANFVPKLLVFLVVFLVGVILAKAISRFVGVLLKRLGFDRLLDRAGAGATLGGAGIDPEALMVKLVYYFILLIGLQLALSAFGPTNPVSQIVNNIVAWLPKALVAVIIVVVAAAVANAVKDLMASTVSTLAYGALLTKIVGGFILALGVIAALNQIGIGLSVTLPVLIAVLATISGILVVGVGGGLIGPMSRRWDGWLNSLTAPPSHHSSTTPPPPPTL